MPLPPVPTDVDTPTPDSPAGGDAGRTDLHTRLAGLEARLAALEAIASAPTAAAGASARATASVDAGGDFWLLDGLDRRLPAGQGAVAYGGCLVDDAGGRLRWQITRLQDDLVGEDWSDLAPRLAALGHPVRLQLLRALARGPQAVGDLAALPGLGTAGQVYHHLRELDAAGWIVAPQRGRWALSPARAVPLLALIAASRS